MPSWAEWLQNQPSPSSKASSLPLGWLRSPRGLAVEALVPYPPWPELETWVRVSTDRQVTLLLMEDPQSRHSASSPSSWQRLAGPPLPGRGVAIVSPRGPSITPPPPQPAGPSLTETDRRRALPGP